MLLQRDLVLDILLRAQPVTRLARVARDHAVPFHGADLLQRIHGLQREEVDHAKARKAADGHEIDEEDDPVLRQAHHERAVGVIQAGVRELHDLAAEPDDAPGVIDKLVGQRRGRVGQFLEPHFRLLVRDDRGARVLERLAAGDVVEVVVAVNQVFDRLAGDLADFRDVVGAAGGPAVGDGIGGDDPLPGERK